MFVQMACICAKLPYVEFLHLFSITVRVLRPTYTNCHRAVTLMLARFSTNCVCLDFFRVRPQVGLDLTFPAVLLFSLYYTVCTQWSVFYSTQIVRCIFSNEIIDHAERPVASKVLLCCFASLHFFRIASFAMFVSHVTVASREKCKCCFVFICLFRFFSAVQKYENTIVSFPV